MIPANFQYHKATSVDNAIALLQQHGDDAKLLAGGHSLLPAMKLRLNKPGVLIDIGRIPDLRYIREENGQLLIGAATTHDDIANSKLIQNKISMLSEAAELIGDLQVRNMGTLGGSLAHADPAADWPALMLAAEATIVLRGPDGPREVTAEDFFLGFYMTDLQPHELITEIRIPLPPAHTKTSYQKFMQPASRFAIVGCAVMITQNNGTCDRVRVAFTGVSDVPYRDTQVEEALTGKPPAAGTIKAAADLAAADVDLMGDHFASEEYRQHLAKVYARRALEAAAS